MTKPDTAPLRAALTDATIGANIRFAREEAKLSQDQLAGAAGVERLAINRMEAGSRKIGALELAAISDALHVPVEDLLKPAYITPEKLERQRVAPIVDGVTSALALLDNSYIRLRTAVKEARRADTTDPKLAARLTEVANKGRAILVAAGRWTSEANNE